VEGTLETLKVSMELLQHHIHRARSLTGRRRAISSGIIIAITAAPSRGLRIFVAEAEEGEHIEESWCSGDCEGKALE